RDDVMTLHIRDVETARLLERAMKYSCTDEPDDTVRFALLQLVDDVEEGDLGTAEGTKFCSMRPDERRRHVQDLVSDYVKASRKEWASGKPPKQKPASTRKPAPTLTSPAAP